MFLECFRETKIQWGRIEVWLEEGQMSLGESYPLQHIFKLLERLSVLKRYSNN